MTWKDVVLPLLLGLLPAILTYMSTQRSLRIERERARADREAAANKALAEVSGSAGEVVALLRDEVKRLSAQLANAILELEQLRGKLEQAETDKEALLSLVEANSKRNDELSDALERASATIDILRSDVARLKKQRRDLIRQNATLIEVAEKTVTA